MDLTFAEQVKIVLGRKNMTIKQLAEEIQEKTGHKMSRQNLTQRLGRDNFQEQDMRMIAEILGCPFQLNILDAVEEEDGERLLDIRRKAEVKAQKKEEKRTELREEEASNDVTVGDMIDMLESVGEAASESVSGEAASKSVSGEAASESESDGAVSKSVSGEAVSESKSDSAASGSVSGGVASKSESDGAASESVSDGAASKSVSDDAVSKSESEKAAAKSVADDAVVKSVSGAAGLEAGNAGAASRSESGSGVLQSGGNGSAAVQPEAKKEKKIPKWEPKPVEKKVDRSSIWNRREEKLRRKKESHPHGDWIGATPQSRSKDFMKDVAESGEINPYTGREYETNSVRMHPKRIGYIQVYDRGNHKWTDMTEWAFYGFQEQKKNLLGPDYDEPIYLD